MARVVTDKQTHINDNRTVCKINTIVYNAVNMSKEHGTFHLQRENTSNMMIYSKQQQ